MTTTSSASQHSMNAQHTEGGSTQMVQVTMMNLKGWVETSTKLAQTTPERRNKTYITQRRRAKKPRIFRRENTWAFDKPVKQDWNTSGKFLAWLHKSKERQNTHRTQQLPVLLWGGSKDREGTCSGKADIRHSRDSCLEQSNTEEQTQMDMHTSTQKSRY